MALTITSSHSPASDMLSSATGRKEAAGSPHLPLSLPASLVAVVLQYLPLTQKITECTHLCHSFPPLDPSHFTHDAIDLQPRILSFLAASATVRAMLCNVACVMLRDADRAVQRQATSSRVQHQPSRPAWFPRSTRVSLTGMVERSPFALLHTMLVPQPPSPPHSLLSPLVPPTVRLPLLHTLRLSVIEQLGEPMEHTAASLQPLSLLPLLRTVVIDELEGGMDYEAFRFLCSLPLTHLDLHGVHVTPTTLTTGRTSDEERLPVTDTWSVLRLPSFDPAVWLTDAMLDTLLGPYIGQERACGLRYISLETPQPAPVFSRLALVRTLQTLDVRFQPRLGVPTHSGALPIGPFLLPPPPTSPSLKTTSSPFLPSLPHLRHLRIRNQLPARNDLPNLDIRVTPAVPYVRLITAYSQQLRVLSLSRMYPFDQRTAVLGAVSQCSQLRVFELNASLGAREYESDPPLTQYQMPTLPHLHTVRLRVPVHPLDVLMLVRACSGSLEDYRQTGPFPLPLCVVREIGSRCQQLRRLECPLEADDAASSVHSPAHIRLPLSSLSANTSGALFPRLISLIVHAERRPAKRPIPSIPSAVQAQTAQMPAVPTAISSFALSSSTASAFSIVAAQPATSPAGFSLPSSPAPSTSSLLSPSVVHMQPEPIASQRTPAEPADTSQLSDHAVAELAALVAQSPVRYLDAACVPLLSVRHFASLIQLRALRCQQSHLQQDQPSHVYVPADSMMPRPLQRYFVTQPAPPQPATRDQMDKLLLTSDLIDDERPVADWQLDDDARGTSYAPSCQRFVRERQFEEGRDGRQAFMAAVRDIAEARDGREVGDEKMAGKRKRSETECVAPLAFKRTAADVERE